MKCLYPKCLQCGVEVKTNTWYRWRNGWLCGMCGRIIPLLSAHYIIDKIKPNHEPNRQPNREATRR